LILSGFLLPYPKKLKKMKIGKIQIIQKNVEESIIAE
jgi:hypothetical protein